MIIMIIMIMMIVECTREVRGRAGIRMHAERRHIWNQSTVQRVATLMLPVQVVFWGATRPIMSISSPTFTTPILQFGCKLSCKKDKDR
jgi:hypothetical protein